MFFLVTTNPSTEHTMEVITLDVWDKLVIIMAAAIFFVFVIACMICVLSPYCVLYRVCPCRHKAIYEKESSKLIHYGTTGPPATPEVWPSQKMLGSIRDLDSSEWSDSSSANVREMKMKVRNGSAMVMPNGSLRSKNGNPTLLSGNIEFSLKYDKFEGKLKINVMQVRDLVVESSYIIQSPYIRVRLYRAPKQIFSLGHVVNNLDTEFRTKLQKNSPVPTYNETFKAAILPEDLKLYTIKFQLCDLDKFSRRVVIGESSVALRKKDIEFSERDFSEKLQTPVEENVGEIYIGMNFLPTAEKLYLTVIKLRGLKPLDVQQTTGEIYVKVTLMHDGRQLKKYKTMTKKDDPNPEFDDTFAFDVPNVELDKVYFCVTALHTNKEQNDTRLIGRMYLGLNFDEVAHAHWTEMMQNSRKQISHWHKLYC
ncbi:hypothetical protein FSP39_012909 [Pinctada imbricata]|uniref:C2 domain-containing protein n=1 Tax=Pinctada imbricata TaxID=66713 RepID=A0AA89C1H8_PINIB|nr:hypothetical protein FSP39_012909 [Pinctada imbricata]